MSYSWIVSYQLYLQVYYYLLMTIVGTCQVFFKLNTFAGSLEPGGSNFEIPELLTFLDTYYTFFIILFLNILDTKN